MTSRTGSPTEPSLAARLWTYQAERFPLFKTTLLCAAFASASISVSATLGGRALPSIPTFAVATFVSIIIFFLLRVADEIKDAPDDRRYRPERAVPRGLVSLALLVRLGAAAAVVAAGAAAALEPALFLVLAGVLGYVALMACEFFVPAWLKARPLAYVASHMLVMPLIALFTTATEWAPTAGAPPPGLTLFLALALMNGFVLEIGRKIWSPASERPGVETYSGLWGAPRAAVIWLACVAVAAAAAAWLSVLLAAPFAIGLALAPVAVVCAIVAVRFAGSPDVAGEKRLDGVSGVWVLVCYVALSLAPLSPGGSA